MIIVNSDRLEGHDIIQYLGLVRGNTVQNQTYWQRYILASIKGIFGGEIKPYTELMTDARIRAMDRMIKHAEELGADAIINIRFSTVPVIFGIAELLASTGQQ